MYQEFYLKRPTTKQNRIGINNNVTDFYQQLLLDHWMLEMVSEYYFTLEFEKTILTKIEQQKVNNFYDRNLI